MTKQLVVISPPGQRVRFSFGEGVVTSAPAPGELDNHVIVEKEELTRRPAIGVSTLEAGGEPPPPPPDWGMTMSGGLPGDLTADEIAGFETVPRMSFNELSARLERLPANARAFVVLRG